MLRAESLLFLFVLLTSLAILAPRPAFGQDTRSGSSAEGLAGGVLGAVSGSTLGLIGGVIGCNRTLDPARCSRISAIAGGMVGLGAGVVIGSRGGSDLGTRFRNAGFGSGVGVLVGVGLRRVVPQYGWSDVGASTVIGLAVGASSVGAGVGVAGGTVTGLLLWKFCSCVGPAGAAGIALAGLALGGLGDWVAQSVGGGETGAKGIPVGLSFRW